ncbi:HrpJ domain-containing protein [Pseudomonas sp. FH1]|uniref:HrpJ domain-containing protein n=1 Tax=Pseudomonas sp. FH1 TaxID=1284392 RepID=UPI0003DDB115|nr:HrpJ domain-containing protein [Pseudomonas sp. FH1]ETK24650.1 type III secretion regulator RspJ [Pseudomonas sp. FH1]
MKVESSPDVQTVQRPDEPAVNQTSTPAPTNGVDELALLFNQEVDANSRPLGERKLNLRVLEIKHLDALYRQLGHPVKKTLALVSLMVREALRQRADVGKLLEIFEGDPARAFLVLKNVRDQAETESRPSEAVLARDAMARLEVRFEGEIQVGLKVAAALQKGEVDPKELGVLRTLYYSNVVARQSLATMMQSLLGLYGGEAFTSGIKVMQKVLANDIAAERPMRPSPLLLTLLQGLQSCMRLSGVLSGCHALLHRLGSDHDALSLLQRLLVVAGSGISASEILRLGSDLGSASKLQQLVALNSLYPLFQQLPLAIWLDGRVREETLRGFLAVIGELDRMTRGPARFPGELGVMA